MVNLTEEKRKKIRYVVTDDMEGYSLDMLSIDWNIVEKLNEVIDYINQRDSLE